MASSCLRKILLVCVAFLLSLAAASPAVPAPYTPIHATKNEWRCLGRTETLGQFLLPERISAVGEELLAKPVQLIAKPDLLTPVKGRAKLISNDGNRARWEWRGESEALQITTSLWAECDGFSWYEIELRPKRPVQLDSLVLQIPRSKRSARYLHAANFSWTQVSRGLPELGGQWTDKFDPYVWLGNEQCGLAWCAESDEGWLVKEAQRALHISTNNDATVFSVTFLDHPETLTSPLRLKFGFQSSPVKPVSFAWRAHARIMHDINFEVMDPEQSTNGTTVANHKTPLDRFAEAGVRTVVFHDMWTDYYGKISTPYGEQLRRLITECHRRGIKLLVYVGYGLARHAPELQGHHDDWSVQPLIPWDPGFRPEVRAFDATCARSGWADWLVAGVEKLFADYELDGLYFDGTTEAWHCQNPAHGCGWKDGEGKLHGDYPLLATRQMMRRIADAVHKHKPDAILDVHMSANLTLPTLSFCDSYWDGEQFEGYTAAEKFELPLDAFQTEFMGYAHGLDAEFLCYVNRPFKLEEALALAGVHGIEVRPYPGTLEQISPLWKAMDRFGTVKAKWLPYWAGSGVRADDPKVIASAWVRDGRALVFVSHLARNKATTGLFLDRKRLALPGGALRAANALTGEALAIGQDSVQLNFEGMEFRLLEVGR